jgi:integrase
MRMGRRRANNKGLPMRVYLHHGSYRYIPRGGKPITLARAGDYSGMLRKLAGLSESAFDDLGTMAKLFNRYEIEVLPHKAETTQADNRRQLGNLRRVFGRMRPQDLRQPDAAKYRDLRGRKAPTAANRELELLSHVCTMAVEWGAMPFHPLAGLRKIRRPPRRRYPTDAEYLAVYRLASPMIRCVMDIALLTALRRGDILALTRANKTDNGLLVRTGKTGAEILFEWTPALCKVVDDALRLPPQVRQPIVCNRKGEAFTKNGFDSVWQRLMDKATESIERFQFRDLRRKSASDEADELVAQARLGHTSVAITNRVYRVKPRQVKPLK